MSAAVDPQAVDSREFIDILDYSFLGDNATVERKRLFIQAYREEGSIYHAALAVRINRKTAYRWIESDPQFAEALEESKEDCYDKAESSVYRKALNGDSLLLMFYLKAHRPKFRDKVTIDIEAVNEEIRERMRQLNSGTQAVNRLQFSPPSGNLQKEEQAQLLQPPATTATTTD